MIHLLISCNVAGSPLEDIAEEEEQPEEEDFGDEDDMADFIVDEEEVDEHGAPVRYGCLFYVFGCSSNKIILIVYVLIDYAGGGS